MAVAVHADNAEAVAGCFRKKTDALNCVEAAALGERFVRKLRRRDILFVRNLDEQSTRVVERQLFDSVYKGITDLVTKRVWPVPAFWMTRACAQRRIHPNAVTIVGMLAMIVATVLWAGGELAWGLVFAWMMTFLDTVDGKLARVTVTSSKLGNKLDHVTDMIHPPFWWFALAQGLSTRVNSEDTTAQIWNAFTIILVGYLLGRLVELSFKKWFGYNAFLWRPFDSAFRTIVARRNIILLITTAGVLVGRPVEAFVAAGIWTLVSVVVQIGRFAQALVSSRGGPLPSWLI
jgi:phosphatidylglycerophosphate synthase